jgi:hypothetical protein
MACYGHWAARLLLRCTLWRAFNLVSVRLLKEIGECPMIDPLSAARQLLTLVDREIRIARRVVFFTCTCGIFPTSSHPPRQRWTVWQNALRDKITQRVDIHSLLVEADKFVALSHARPIVIGPADAAISVRCDYLD